MSKADAAFNSREVSLLTPLAPLTLECYKYKTRHPRRDLDFPLPPHAPSHGVSHIVLRTTTAERLPSDLSVPFVLRCRPTQCHLHTVESLHCEYWPWPLLRGVVGQRKDAHQEAILVHATRAPLPKILWRGAGGEGAARVAWCGLDQAAELCPQLNAPLEIAGGRRLRHLRLEILPLRLLDLLA